jgi:MFS family permease
MKESVWSPLQSSVYRSFWLCAFLSNLGTWIQDVAAGWVMTHLSTSPLVISLLSFSSSLPILLLSIPAGVLSDYGQRRKLLLIAQCVMFAAAGMLAYLVWQKQITESILVFLSMIMGVGMALTGPAFQSVLSDLVPVEQQSKAVLVYYMGINLTRILGPTLGGILLGSFGPGVAFMFNSISFLGLIVFFWRWPVKETISVEETPKYAHNDWLHIFALRNLKLWWEIFLVTFCASSLWALYPTRGRIDLHLNSWQYGSLLAFLGIGATISAVFSDRMILPERTPKALVFSYIVFGIGIFLLGLAENYPTICVAMVFAGVGWIILATLMNMSSRQISGHAHLKSTRLGAFFAVFYAGMASGSVSWGAMAKLSSTKAALTTAAIVLVLIAIVKFQGLIVGRHKATPH